MTQSGYGKMMKCNNSMDGVNKETKVWRQPLLSMVLCHPAVADDQFGRLRSVAVYQLPITNYQMASSK
jgi:hypothetical protein